MKNKKPLPHYPAKTTWENGTGYLIDSRGNRLPGITSILKATQSPKEKACLSAWRRKVGNAEANRIIRESRDRGNIIHNLAKNYLEGQTVNCPPAVGPYWDTLLPVLENLNQIRLLEGHVFHYYEGYAGRVDCVANYQDIPCAIEFQSATHIKPLYDKPLQLAAYCGALNRQYPLKLNNALLIVATPKETIVNWFPPKELIKYWREWQQRVAQFWQGQAVA